MSSSTFSDARHAAGLNRGRILAKAVARGLVQPGQSLAEHEIYNLIFEPGLSTAEQVSNLSGRGVGMDVVRQNIEALRGTVELESIEGQGTTVRIRLPLTRAIIDGFLVGIGDAAYVVPLDMVLECGEFSETDRQAATGRAYINLRGEVLPFLRLRDHFGLGGCGGHRESIVVVRYGAHKAGLVAGALPAVRRMAEKSSAEAVEGSAVVKETVAAMKSIAERIGIGCYPEHGRDVDTLLLNADQAMYLVKEAGRNGFRMYSPSSGGIAADPAGAATAPDCALRD